MPFLLATSFFAFTPGPGMFYMAIQTMVHGAKAGWLSSFAFHVASYLHILLAAFGVTVLLKTAPYLLLVLKLAGAAYLIWMGLRMLLKTNEVQSAPTTSVKKTSSQAFKDSLIVEILNPKSALFYFAFLPQFTSSDGSAEVWLQILLLGTIADVMFSATDVVCILSARLVAAGIFSSVQTAVWGRRIGGSILIAMGAKTATGTN
ncbi:LysE family translocator [Octadecabacter antarcticus]|nr:LysE family translocator [Octadecabacter antarcticus]